MIKILEIPLMLPQDKALPEVTFNTYCSLYIHHSEGVSCTLTHFTLLLLLLATTTQLCPGHLARAVQNRVSIQNQVMENMPFPGVLK